MIVFILISGILLLAFSAYYLLYLGPKLDPKNRAENFIVQKKYHDAIREYRKILDFRPNDVGALYRLANAYIQIQQPDSAATLLEKISSIDTYPLDVEKLDVHKKLGRIYNAREDLPNTFRIFYDIVNDFPTDTEALYHIAFIALGQEEFDIAWRHFDRLIRLESIDFETLFGAGICAYQNQKINECVDLFKSAVDKNPNSVIANLAAAFANRRKREYGKALQYTEKIVGISEEKEVLFIAKRLEAVLSVHLKKFEKALKSFELLIEFVKANGMDEEYLICLYDTGFSLVRADRITEAIKYWTELSQKRRNYRDIQNLIMTLHRELDKSDTIFDDSIHDYVEDWLSNVFPDDFLWNICGLKAETKIDIKPYFVQKTKEVSADSEKTSFDKKYSGTDKLEALFALDTESFRSLANRLVQKLGYRVEEVMTTYRESDGIDFMATHRKSDERTFVSVRRWSKMRIGEIPLRNFAQQVNEVKAKRGLFITSAELTEGAQNAASSLSKVEIILPDQLNQDLNGLL